ncbi:MAG TPA: type II secretion system protein [Candidatus Saccharimonadales bacterium]|nr:type II secretion system protein [Candidatus Saccharimonadales bacterium]
MKNIFDKAGFTLVELIIVMGITSIFVVVLTDIFVSLTAAKLESEATAAVVEDGRFILARLTYDVERSTTITTPLILGSSGSTLVLNIGGTSHTYALSGENLTLNNSSTTSNLNSNRTAISGITFQKLGNSGTQTVRVTFTVTGQAVNQAPISQTFSTTVAKP